MRDKNWPEEGSQPKAKCSTDKRRFSNIAS
jgi:hypothetical protein